jgi:hypothetical protein
MNAADITGRAWSKEGVSPRVASARARRIRAARLVKPYLGKAPCDARPPAGAGTAEESRGSARGFLRSAIAPRGETPSLLRALPARAPNAFMSNPSEAYGKNAGPIAKTRHFDSQQSAPPKTRVRRPDGFFSASAQNKTPCPVTGTAFRFRNRRRAAARQSNQFSLI